MNTSTTDKTIHKTERQALLLRAECMERRSKRPELHMLPKTTLRKGALYIRSDLIDPAVLAAMDL